MVVPISLDPLLSTLKPRQLDAIKHTQAPQLILAGTGKTTTITAKIAYMGKKKHRTLSDTRPHLLQRSCKEHADKCGIFDKIRVGARYYIAFRGYIVRRILIFK